MNFSNRSKLIFCVILFILSCAGCFLLGIYQTKKYVAKIMMNQLYESAATSLSLRVKLLKMLRSGQLDKGEDMLEKLVDVELDTLVLYKRIPSSQRSPEIIESIRMAKDYRKMFPQHQVAPNIANSVKSALELAE